MHRDPAINIVGYSRVERSIPALQNIEAPGLLCRFFHAQILSNCAMISKMIMDSPPQRRYYSGMKKGVDYIGIGAGAIIFNRNDELFLAKRGNEAGNEKHRWEFPGGSVEFGETLSDALRREILEEYGFTIDVVRLLDVVDHILPEEKQHWVSPTFLCTYKSGTPSIREPHKCEDIGWFRLVSIPEKDLTSASRKSLESLKRYLSASPSAISSLVP